MIFAPQVFRLLILRWQKRMELWWGFCGQVVPVNALEEWMGFQLGKATQLLTA